ncbi:MAG TPA: enolase C-terminal domain-like protein, partial [Xanthobacteraceae bacterium]
AGTPVAAGENAGTLGDIERLIEARVDYLQPSLTKIGGVTEMRRIIALAAARGVALAPHSPYFGPGLIATVHVCASLPAPPPVERFYCDLEASPFGDQVNASDGHLRVPAGAGLGLTVDETVIERYRVAR